MRLLRAEDVADSMDENGKSMTILLALAVLAAPVQARAAEPLPPLGKWTVAHEQRLCHVSRTFGTPAAETLLMLRPYLGR